MANWLTTGSTAPFLIVPALGGGFAPSSTAAPIATSGNVWVYRTTDALSTVVGSQYFTDGFRRGMRQFDLVAVVDVNTPKATWTYVSSLSTVSTGGATVSAFAT